MNHSPFFELAAETARQATCHRARCGSVVVSAQGDILGLGFNAPPLNDEEQRRCEEDYDLSSKPKSDKTCCVHAEWNAILDALSNDASKVKGSTLYFMRVDEEGAFTQAGEPYCTVCSRLALQSGVAIFGLWNDGPEMIPTDVYNSRSYDYHLPRAKVKAGFRKPMTPVQKIRLRDLQAKIDREVRASLEDKRQST